MISLKKAFEQQKQKTPQELWGDLEFLFLETLGIDRIELYSQHTQCEIEKLTELETLTEELIAGKPLAYILKRQFFYNYEFYVDDRVLIPRPETEFLVHLICQQTEGLNTLMDIGAGSGCIGISLLLHFQNSFCVFVEKSREAQDVIRLNLNDAHIDKQRYRIFTSLEEAGQFLNSEKKWIQLVVSNPPYIEVGDSRVESAVHGHEPHMALYSEDNGLYHLKTWIDWVLEQEATKSSESYFEFGKGQGNALSEYVKSRPYQVDFQLLKDQYGVNRFIRLKRSE